ncbi:hypothetical protein DAPPUDRAFT_333566 [Daphnia pulex]|uniref:Uncharacterized protein n=1 Tax=Daphnia pulex TaxID=6669 RepID=E9HT67_DAPPU|nr:hypothetical protein DAPPUDRAFT_333566 [Daphnia pulex]|eukprot:EFX65063.1 hypothetical protein DAPPUDRAFT_333566 [Daphnia pulex]
MANKVKKELPVCLTCLEKWARVDSQDKEASQVYLESGSEGLPFVTAPNKFKAVASHDEIE